MDTQRAWQTLREYAEGRIEHRGFGSCPDSIEGHAARDSDCPVCQALDAARCLAQIEEPAQPVADAREAFAGRYNSDPADPACAADLAIYSAGWHDARAGAAPAAVVPLPQMLEKIAQGWDGCEYDAPGETLDIGADIRATAARLLAEQPSAAAGPAADGWLQDGGLLYRLTDERRPCNRDEINVTMADGSRTDEARARRAGELLDRIRGAAPALEAPAAPDCEQLDVVARKKLGVLLNAFGEAQWQAGRGVPCPSIEDAFEAVISAAVDLLAAAPQAPAAPSAEGLREQHDRDSAELRRLCQARDEARRERDIARAEIAGLQASTGHLSALVDGQHALLEKAKATMTALHGSASPIDESGGDFDARIPASAFARFVDEHAALLHAMAQSPVAAPAAPAVDAPAKGEVVVEVHGLTGSGKSALCGEIEIMCRALGLAVTWADGKSEKNLTGADWTEALELYKPRVRIVERNHAAQAKEGGAAC